MSRKTERERLEERVEAAKKILAERGVRVQISSCGCCDTPWVAIEVDGEMILGTKRENGSVETEDGASMYMFPVGRDA